MHFTFLLHLSLDLQREQFEYLEFFTGAILYLTVTCPEDTRAPHPTDLYLKLQLK